MKNISGTDQNRLMVLEKVIERNHQAVVDWYDALCEIKRDKLYRGAYESWADYCQTRWNLTPQVVNAKIRAEDTRRSLPKSERIHSLSDHAASEVAKIHESKREAVVQKASEATDGKPTAKAIREAAKDEKPERAKSGKEKVSPAHRKEALSLIGRLVRALDKMGIGDKCEPNIEAIIQEIKAS